MSRTTGQHNFSTMRGMAMKTNTQNERSQRLAMAASLRSGEGGIRTHGALACTLVFETSTIVQAACARRGGCRSDAALPPIRIAAKIEGTCVIDSGS
jgi:hypothetical protein